MIGWITLHQFLVVLKRGKSFSGKTEAIMINNNFELTYSDIALSYVLNDKPGHMERLGGKSTSKY